MQDSIFFGGSVVAALIAGSIALFAPCCISVMLPAYFATSFQNRGRLVAMTFLFAAGVATIILPIALGAAVLLRVINAGHTPLYVAGGVIMLALGVYTLLGGKINLPSPGGRPTGSTGPVAVYSLGLFSGVASSCCAPVLAGLITLSGISASLPAALGLGIAYVIGMVAPLFVMALLWEAVDWRARGLFRPRRISYRLGPFQRTIGVTDLASGVLLVVLGVVAAAIGISGQSTPAGGGWQAMLALWLQQVGASATARLAWLPNWAVVLLIATAAGALVWRALRQVGAVRRRADHEQTGDLRKWAKRVEPRS